MERIQYLIERYINDQANSQEKIELADLVNTLDDQTITDHLKICWNNFNAPKSALSQQQSTLILEQILEHKKQQTIPIKRKVWFKVAASLLILLSLGGGIFLYQTKQLETENNQSLAVANNIIPGGNKAVLLLSNGSEVVLDTVQNGFVANQSTTNITKLNTGQIAYNSSNNTLKTNVYNTIVTPRGGQYQLILPDNSKVLLNAASSIRFPVAFNGNDRRIEITGEVYFEVSENKFKPFVVIVNDVEVQVFGTHFIVSAYDKDQVIKTTLMEGAVKVTKGKEYAMLTPGQQAQVNRNGTLTIEKQVNLTEESAWVNGIFYFDHSSLEDIMKQIGRWYDVEVEYQDVNVNKTFSGIVKRSSNISEVLKIMEYTGLKFLIEDRTIIVGN